MMSEGFQNAASEVLLRRSLQLMSKLGVKTVVEGVETALQADGLRKYGVDYLQGYFYSRPKPMADAVAEMIAQ